MNWLGEEKVILAPALQVLWFVRRRLAGRSAQIWIAGCVSRKVARCR